MRSIVCSLFLLLSLSACESVYYSAAEKVGVHKRDILVDRVEASRDSQAAAEEEFSSALERFRSLVEFDGGELLEVYEELNGEYERALSAAEEVEDRIDAVESVAEALFDEWEDELQEYSNASFKARSQGQLRDTRLRYESLLKTMRKAESRMAPVLSAFRDNVLFLKHNLNARALSALKSEFAGISRDVDALLADMRRSIEESNAFIVSMHQ